MSLENLILLDEEIFWLTLKLFFNETGIRRCDKASVTIAPLRYRVDDHLLDDPSIFKSDQLRLVSWELVFIRLNQHGSSTNFSMTSAVEDLRAELKHITQRWKRKQQRCS